LLTAHYADFGPTLATEKLVEVHELRVSVPTVRKWMIELGLWTPRQRRAGGRGSGALVALVLPVLRS
ncbi:MAG: hypothetical protein AAF447_27565, partial [Myxococcota bacterium]